MSEIPKEMSEVAMGDMADLLTSFYKRLLSNGLSEQVAMALTQDVPGEHDREYGETAMNWKAIRRAHQGPHVCRGTAIEACAVGNPQPRRGPGRPRPKRAAVRGRNFKAAMAKFERIHRARRERNALRAAARLRLRAEV